MKKKVLLLILIWGMMPLSVKAESISDNDDYDLQEESLNSELETESNIVESGKCGDNATYTLDADGVLTISGSGMIYSHHFKERVDVKEILIKEGIEQVGFGAFEYCINVTRVSLPYSITSINENAYKGCVNLQHIVIPPNAQVVWYAFSNCDKLKTAGPVGGGFNIEFYWKTEIPRHSFWGSSIESITFPVGLTSIKDNAFAYCDNLKEIKIPFGVTSIEMGAFEHCKNLTYLEIPRGVTNIGSWAFHGCINLEKVIILEEVTMRSPFFLPLFKDSLKLKTAGPIGSGCDMEYVFGTETPSFEGYSSLVSVEIPQGVTSIRSSAFKGCRNLINLEIPESVTYIGRDAFRGCDSLNSIKIPEGVETISESAFEECSGLKEITIPKTVRDIRNYAFRNCPNLEKVTVYSKNVVFGDFVFFNDPVSVYGYEYSDVKNYAEVNNIPFFALEPDENDVPEGPATWIGKTGTEGFVYRLYNVAMSREADEGGFNDWNGKLQRRERSAAEVAQGFIFSEEFKNREYNDIQYVKILYRTMFGREADEGGLNDWLSKLENGMSREYVFRGFAESLEFSNLCDSYGVVRGSVTLSAYRDKNAGATGFIARLYTKMLGRSYDAEGLEYWCRKYLTGENTIEEVATVGFLHSTELANQNLSNEEFVKRMYQTFLNREPDPAGLEDWIGRLNSGNISRDELVYGFTNSIEFGKIKASYGL